MKWTDTTLSGFDNITYGFCLQQCVTESVVGALVGVSAVIGTLFVKTCQKPVIFPHQIPISKSEFSTLDEFFFSIFKRRKEFFRKF